MADHLGWHPAGASYPFQLDVPALFHNAAPL